eukprot:TRINITY_DN3124_c0_g1_i3.p1 TRINITY_DN3124_c0_g1~~TRINITY_DN3124_c0_g1_i3.p1  ORF type:complete len:381 (+),score=92.47 TRINITY_DN3124_c0_g1_i3:623-1765(+)
MEAKGNLQNQEAETRKVVEELEKNMEFLAVTGVEDLLQEDVQVAITNLRSAGIKLWMLTGDKIETAICIAISCQLKMPTDGLELVKDITDPSDFERRMNQIFGIEKSVFVIDGTTLEVVLKDENLKALFFSIAGRAPSVVCCRCSPTQKAEITEFIKKLGKKTCAIGDGGNDVGMIQSADVGVGIVGKEGMQAALAADFSILQFKNLTKLILWHGRLAYKRSAMLAQFVIHRGLIISIIQAIFTSMFYFASIPIYNGYLMLGYTTIYTVLPVFSIIYDSDVSYEKAMQFPILYRNLLKGRELNTKTFLIWFWQSIYQAALIMVLGVYWFSNSFTNIVTITFTCLILSEYLNILSTASKSRFIASIQSCGVPSRCPQEFTS